MIEKIELWTEVTSGIFRYIVAANACYEIHVIHHDWGTDLLTATASLYIAGDWQGDQPYFERECLLFERPLSECIEFAIKDYKENNRGIVP